MLWYGIAYAVLFCEAHFNRDQSIVITFVAVCAIDGYRRVFKIAEKRYEICHDLDLAAGDKWEELGQRCRTAPAAGYGIVQNGFNFTLLSPSLLFQ